MTNFLAFFEYFMRFLDTKLKVYISSGKRFIKVKIKILDDKLYISTRLFEKVY